MNYNLTVTKRTDQAHETRAAGKIPAVIYGGGLDPVSAAVDYTTFSKLYAEAGESSLVDLVLESEPTSKVLIQEVQLDPVSEAFVHVDFRRIDMNKEMVATIEVNLIGESDAVKSLGGTLNIGLDELNIKCLPKDLVSHVDVDISSLKNFEDSIHVKDIALPAGIVTIDNPETLVANVSAPLTEEQLKAMEETKAGTVEDVKVEEKGKKEDKDGEKQGEKKEAGA